MSSATHVVTHATDAASNLIGFIKNKANLTALINALGGEIQAAEDVFWDELTKRDINSSVGQQLDNIGDIVVLPRAGLNDADYRVQIRAKVLINISSGLINELINIFTLVTANANTVTIKPSYPAQYIMIFGNALTVTVANLLALITSANPAGVQGKVIYQGAATPNSQVFLLDNAPSGLDRGKMTAMANT